MPGRWLGSANQALPILKVGSRRLSGQLETMFGSLIADKTDWRNFRAKLNLNLIEQKSVNWKKPAPKIQTIREEFSQNLEFNETVELLEK